MVDVNIMEYVDIDDIRAAVLEEIKDSVREALRNERRVSNLMYEVAQHEIDKTLESELGTGWRKKLVAKASEAISKGDLNFFLFREGLGRVTKEGPGMEPLREAVKKNADRIEQRVIKNIDTIDDMDLGDMLRDALVSRLGGANE